MDKTNALKIVQEYAGVVKARFDYKKIILFGSYAKGNYLEDSDIDVAIVFTNYDNRMDRQFELMKLTREVDSRIEPHPFRENEFDLSNGCISNCRSQCRKPCSSLRGRSPKQSSKETLHNWIASLRSQGRKRRICDNLKYTLSNPFVNEIVKYGQEISPI